MRHAIVVFATVLGFGFLFLLSQTLHSATAGGTPLLDEFIYLPIVLKPETPPPNAPWIVTDTITISSYQYDHPDCLVATEPGDFVYPYPRINHDCVFQKPKIDRVFTAISLHNDYTAITILPQLGGRLYQWHDKVTGRQLLYNNPVLKPTAWGWRGWWLATGGIEWAFPTDEHGLNEFRPWNYTLTQTAVSATIILSDTEDQTGMLVGVTLSLDRDHAYMTIEPWVENNTAVSHDFQYWLNAMIAMNDNHSASQTEFIVPADQVIIHSTGDGDLPGEHGVISWPFYDSRNLNQYGTWTDYIGFFAPILNDDYTGMYDHDLQQGILRVFDGSQIPGHKFFGPASLGSGLWTDDDSDYVEMWSSGVTADFWTYANIEANTQLSWQEKWLPYNQFPTITTANKNGLLAVQQVGDMVMIDVMSTAVTSGTLTILSDGQPQQSWATTLEPGYPQHAEWERPSTLTSPLTIQLQNPENNILLTYEQE